MELSLSEFMGILIRSYPLILADMAYVIVELDGCDDYMIMNSMSYHLHTNNTWLFLNN